MQCAHSALSASIIVSGTLLGYSVESMNGVGEGDVNEAFAAADAELLNNLVGYVREM